MGWLRGRGALFAVGDVQSYITDCRLFSASNRVFPVPACFQATKSAAPRLNSKRVSVTEQDVSVWLHVTRSTPGSFSFLFPVASLSAKQPVCCFTLLMLCGGLPLRCFLPPPPFDVCLCCLFRPQLLTCPSSRANVPHL